MEKKDFKGLFPSITPHSGVGLSVQFGYLKKNSLSIKNWNCENSLLNPAPIRNKLISLYREFELLIVFSY